MPESIPLSLIDITEKCEATWRNYLAEWDEKIWPIFSCHGFSRDAALSAWFMNRSRQSIEEWLERMEPDA